MFVPQTSSGQTGARKANGLFCFVGGGGGQVVNQGVAKDLSNYTNPKGPFPFTIGGA
eukprot:COSAG06_NODE_42170_length_384_cov_0.775439_1_plen_56_part_10